MKFVSRHCFLPVGNAMKIQTSWLSIGLCLEKSHKPSIKSHIWLLPLTPSPPHLVHLAFQVCMIFVLLCDPMECVLFQLQPKFTAPFFHQGVMHGDTSTSESIHIYLSL